MGPCRVGRVVLHSQPSSPSRSSLSRPPHPPPCPNRLSESVAISGTGAGNSVGLPKTLHHLWATLGRMQNAPHSCDPEALDSQPHLLEETHLGVRPQAGPVISSLHPPGGFIALPQWGEKQGPKSISGTPNSFLPCNGVTLGPGHSTGSLNRTPCSYMIRYSLGSAWPKLLKLN